MNGLEQYPSRMLCFYLELLGLVLVLHGRRGREVQLEVGGVVLEEVVVGDVVAERHAEQHRGLIRLMCMKRVITV